jgi:hypothetical protein
VHLVQRPSPVPTCLPLDVWGTELVDRRSDTRGADRSLRSPKRVANARDTTGDQSGSRLAWSILIAWEVSNSPGLPVTGGWTPRTTPSILPPNGAQSTWPPTWSASDTVDAWLLSTPRWARATTVTDPAHVSAAAALRRAYQHPPPEVQGLVRDLADYDKAFGRDWQDPPQHRFGRHHQKPLPTRRDAWGRGRCR